jgi:uncharacterized protein (DUF427 family)
MAGPEITIEPAKGAWSVRAQGAVIGETTNALILREGDYAPVIYVPRDDLQMVFFDTSDKTTHCPHKGDATYFHLIGKSRRQKNVAWSYQTPHQSVAAIKDHVAFYGSEVTVEAVS